MSALNHCHVDGRRCQHGRPVVIVDSPSIYCGHCRVRPDAQTLVGATLLCDGEKVMWILVDGLVVHRCGEDSLAGIADNLCVADFEAESRMERA